MTGARVAFYAPLKPPDHPVPSGDRTMGRLLFAALRRAGYDPRLASRLRSFDADGCEDRQRRIAALADDEARRLAAFWTGAGSAARPDAWFTYHCYYKAPDHLGPAIARRLSIPYLVAEPSVSPRRADGPWRFGHAAVTEGLARAARLFVLTGKDVPALSAAGLGPLVPFPPFFDREAWPAIPRRPEGPPVRLLAVAMMRPGDKLRSFRLLADALRLLPPGPAWRLDIAGDGPARAEVAAAFGPFGDAVRFHAEVADRGTLAALYANADLLVWPAVNEAYGMVLLEAQAMGCPVLAGDFGGVRDALVDGRTGHLVPPGDAPAFAAALSRLLAAPDERLRLGRAAADFVARERGLDDAAAILRTSLRELGL